MTSRHLAASALLALSLSAPSLLASERWERSNLDDPPPPPGSVAEYDMVAGRLAKLPVSWFFRRTYTFTGTHGARFKTTCLPSSDPAPPCDTGMIVTFLEGLTPRTYYNNDDPAGGRGSAIDAGSRPAATTYTVYVFSQTRSTSLAVFSWWDSANQRYQEEGLFDFGGAVVKVGPLLGGDFVEVQSAEDSAAGDFDTRMVLFDTGSCAGGTSVCLVTGKGALFGDNWAHDGRADFDARLQVNSVLCDRTNPNCDTEPWDGPDNFALVGKTSTRVAVNKGTEVRVDLVRGPASPVGSVTLNGVNSVPLPPGRYYAWVYAAVATSVGDFPAGSTEFTASAKHFMTDFGGGDCNQTEPGTNLLTWRGHPNGPTFDMWLERYNPATSTWNTVSGPRRVPLALLGTRPGDGWNLLLLEAKVDTPGHYRMRTAALRAGISFFGDWRYQRNPDASELKVVTFNQLYKSDFSHARNKILNMSDLLASRGEVNDTGGWYPAGQFGGFVIERQDQAFWQWDADVVGLQELDRWCDFGLPDGVRFGIPPCDAPPIVDQFFLGDQFKNRARNVGSLDWAYVKGRDEDNWIGTFGLGPLFVNEQLWPDAADPHSIQFAPGDLADDCNAHGDDFRECHLFGNGSAANTDNFAVPGKVAARRFGALDPAGDPQADRPIAVFNIHLESDNDEDDDRRTEVGNLIDTIKQMLARDPGAFNGAGHASPLHHQNRIVILGDANLYPHACGEHFGVIKRLRDEFGYALDVSMARYFPVGQSQLDAAMHHAGSFVYDVHRVPDPYQQATDWRAAPLDFGWDSIYPWWAASFRNTGTVPENLWERFDFVILVGKGWAYDDPVRDYAVMSDRDHSSPLNPGATGLSTDPDGGGVEMFCDHARPGLVTNGTVRGDGIPNYAPNFDLGHFGTGAGAPALHSDHKPVGVRLRVFVR